RVIGSRLLPTKKSVIASPRVFVASLLAMTRSKSGRNAMFNRRTFLSAAAGTLATSGFASAQQPGAKAALYANVGPALTRYDIDVDNAELIKRETVTLPAGVQYAWPHASRRYLYVATSSSASGYGPAGTEHHVTALAVDPATGALTQH